jgi:eukaryotic-like serine/threonine-protein kinase
MKWCSVGRHRWSLRQAENLTADGPNAGFPSFSRDGRWIYFCSIQNGHSRVWKIPASGGAPVRVTTDEGILGIESHDGRDLYYVTAIERPGAVWRVPVAGGTPVKILDGVLFGSFDVIERGIYYIDRVSGGAPGFFTDRAGGDTRLQFFDFTTRLTSTVSHNLGDVVGLSASRDGGTVFFSRSDSSVDELMVVNGFE